jgi:hypothetical protein
LTNTQEGVPINGFQQWGNKFDKDNSITLFVILFQYDEGWQMIQSCLEKRINKKVPEVLKVLKSLLCFDAWLNQSLYWETSNPACNAKLMAKHQDSIRIFMDMLENIQFPSRWGERRRKRRRWKEKKQFSSSVKQNTFCPPTVFAYTE